MSLLHAIYCLLSTRLPLPDAAECLPDGLESANILINNIALQRDQMFPTTFNKILNVLDLISVKFDRVVCRITSSFDVKLFRGIKRKI
jgi:hypothetical protein